MSVILSRLPKQAWEALMRDLELLEVKELEWS